MTAYKDEVLKESSRILDYILKEELAEDEKDRIVTDSIDNFNNHVNPGWLEYRKSVSTDATFVEWEDSQETFKDTHGNEFIDCLGGFGIYTAGHRNPEIVAAVQELKRVSLEGAGSAGVLDGLLEDGKPQISAGFDFDTFHQRIDTADRLQ